jgi:Carboxypeptidase regulatory-like domain
MRLLVVLGLVLSGSLEAEAQDRRLAIRVEDPSGATIPNAQIIVLSGSDVMAQQNADSRGLASISIGRAQQVKLIVTAPGFAPSEVEVTVPARTTTHPVTVALTIASIETDVTVSATQ